MKKKLSLWLAAFAFVAVAGISAMWFTAAEATRSNVEYIIAAWNDANKAIEGENADRFSLTYDSLETSGFPLRITVRLVKPRITMATTAEDGTDTRLRWVSEGYADLVTNHFGREYRINLRGDDTLAMQIGPETLTLKGKNSDMSAYITARSYDDFARWEQLDIWDKESRMEFLQGIHGAGIVTGALHYVDAATHQTVMTQQASRLVLQNNSGKERLDAGMELYASASEVAPAYGEFIGRFSQLLAGAPVEAVQDVPFASSRAGKQDIDIAGRISMPLAAKEKYTDFTLDLTRNHIRNNYYEMRMPLFFRVLQNEEGLKLAFKQDLTLTVNPASAAETRRAVDQLVTSFGPILGLTDEDRSAAFKKKLLEALPALSALGPVNIVYDLALDAGQGRKANLTLGRFRIAHERWAIDASGTASNTESPNIAMTLTCTPCARFTEDSMTAASQWQDALHAGFAGQTSLPFGKDMLAAIDELLSSLGDSDGDGTVTLAVTTPAPGDIHINDQPVGLVVLQAMAALEPVLAPAKQDKTLPR